MDFDEYEYLEKTVENSDPLQESNGTSVKRKSDEDVYYRNDENKKHKGDEDSDQRDRSKRDTDEERYREKEKDRVKDRSDKVRESERPDRGSKEREKDKDRHRDRESERLDRGSKEREKDKDRHRDRDKDRYKEWDWDREKSRDREREYDRDRERSKSKSRNPDHYHDRERSKSKSRNPDHYRDRESSKSRSRNTDHYHDRERAHSRSRERDRTRDIERGRETRERVKEIRHSRERREEKECSITKEPEADLERDQRTVFAYQLCLKANEYDVYEFFSKAGKVRDVRLIMDRNSRRSKGVGYIEFYDVMSVPSAIALSGQILKGQPVMVKPSEAEKNLIQPTPSNGALTGPNSGLARRLYVGNLHFNIKEDQLRQVFEPFGAVEFVQLPVDPETGHCKGFGFVQYARLEDAQSAQQALNGVLELAGRIMKVSAVSDQVGVQDSAVALGELDDDEGGGVSLTARSRAILMQKLDRTGTVTSLSTSGIAAPLVNPNAVPIVSSLIGAINPLGIPGLANALQAAEPIGVPSECLLLKNMFDPKTETEPDFELDIKEDALQECSKFGAIKHIFVDKNSEGHVYLRFESLTASLNAQSSLHGRWFAGRMIATQFWTVTAYEAKFPDSK